MNSALVRILVSGGVGVVVGTGIGYAVGSTLTRKKWQAYAEEQIAEVKEHYKILRKEGEYGDPETVPNASVVLEESLQERGAFFDPNVKKDPNEVAALADEILKQGYDVAEQIIGVAEDEGLELESAVLRVSRDTENIFDKVVVEGPDGRPRDTSRPYVITFEEWTATQDGEFSNHETPTIRYYIRDDTAINEDEGILLYANDMLGENNLEWFVNEEFDPMVETNVFYVRNEQMDVSVEILVFQMGYVDSLQMDNIEDEEMPKPRRKPKDYQEE